MKRIWIEGREFHQENLGYALSQNQISMACFREQWRTHPCWSGVPRWTEVENTIKQELWGQIKDLKSEAKEFILYSAINGKSVGLIMTVNNKIVLEILSCRNRKD